MTNMSVFQILFIVIFISCLPAADSLGVELECPDLFHNGENTVICRINKTAIAEANCFSMYKSVTFDWTLKDRTTVACLSPEYDPNSQCTLQSDPGSCRCQESNGEILTYEFSFLANRTLDEGGQLECKLCILPDKPLPINISKGCQNISFADDSEPDTPNSDQSDTVAVIVAVVVCVVILVIVIIVMIIVIRRKKASSSRCRKARKERGDIPHEEENGATDHEAPFIRTILNAFPCKKKKKARKERGDIPHKEENGSTGHEAVHLNSKDHREEHD